MSECRKFAEATIVERGAIAWLIFLLTHSYHLVLRPQADAEDAALSAARHALCRGSAAKRRPFGRAVRHHAQRSGAGFQSALEQHRPRIVVVYEDNFNFLTKMCLTRMREVAYHILEALAKAGAMVLVNGSDASDHAVDYLRKGFRCVLLGEAEWTLLEVVRHLLKRRRPRLAAGSGARIPAMTRLDELIRTDASSPDARSRPVVVPCARFDRCRSIPIRLEDRPRLFFI